MSGVVRDTYLVFLRYLRPTLRSRVAMVFGAMQPLLYLVLFGPLLKRVFPGGQAWEMFVPGMLVLFGAGFAGFALIADLRSGVAERLRVTPVSRVALLLGRVLRDVLVLAVQALLLVVAGLALGLRAPVAGVLVGMVLVVALAAAIASLSYVLAMVTRREDAFAPLLSTVTLPVMLLSGILLPMGLAPGWLQGVSRLMPLRYVVDGARAAFAGDLAAGALVRGAGVTVVLLVASVALGAWRFRRENA